MKRFLKSVAVLDTMVLFWIIWWYLFCAALPLSTPFSLSLSLLLESLPALALPLVLLLAVLFLSFFVWMKLLPSVQELSTSQQLLFLLLITFLVTWKSWTLNLTLSYFWIICLIFPVSLLLSANYVPYTRRIKLSGQYLQTIVCLYTGSWCSLASHEFQPTF